MLIDPEPAQKSGSKSNRGEIVLSASVIVNSTSDRSAG